MLPKVIRYRDLKVKIINDLKTAGNRSAAAAKSFRVLLSIRKSFNHLNEEMFMMLSPTFKQSPRFKHETDML